jgi:hypothetical protein
VLILTLVGAAAHLIEHPRNRVPAVDKTGNFVDMGLTGGIACCVLIVAIVALIVFWWVRNRLGPKQPPPPPPDDPTAPKQPGRL